MKNKNQKRIRNRAWAWIVAAGLTIGSLTGCGSQTVEQTAQDEKTDGEVTITIWHDKEDAVTQVLEEEFTQLEPQIHVVLEKRVIFLLFLFFCFCCHFCRCCFCCSLCC